MKATLLEDTLSYNDAKNGDTITVKIMSGTAADQFSIDGVKMTPIPTYITYIFDSINDKIDNDEIDNDEKDNEDQKEEVITQEKDNTIINASTLPQTGESFIKLYIILFVLSVFIIVFIKYRKYKDIN